MIHLLERQFVARRKWMDRDEFLNMVAIAESTPGPVAVNSATYIGYKVDGIAGAISATCAVCIPSFVIIYLISLFFKQFMELKLKDNLLIALINRNGKIIIPSGTDSLMVGDTVVIVTTHTGFDAITDILG